MSRSQCYILFGQNHHRKAFTVGAQASTYTTAVQLSVLQALSVVNIAAWPQVLAEKVCATAVPAGHSREADPEPACTAATERLPIKSLLEFDRDRKSMSVLAAVAPGSNVLLVKGAAECVLERASWCVRGLGLAVCICAALPFARQALSMLL
jgi:magnesium-transporting ATPase (P-type)